MSKRVFNLVIDAAVSKELDSIINDAAVPERLRTHATALKLSTEGLECKDIAKELDVNQKTVKNWFSAFEISGVQSVFDEPRTGRRKKDLPSIEHVVKQALYDEAKNGNEVWTNDDLSSSVHISEPSVKKVLDDLKIDFEKTKNDTIKIHFGVGTNINNVHSIYISKDCTCIIFCNENGDKTFGRLYTQNERLNNEIKEIKTKNRNMNIEDITNKDENNESIDNDEIIDIQEYINEVVESLDEDKNYTVILF